VLFGAALRLRMSVANVEGWVMLNLNPAIWEAIAGTGRGVGIEVVNTVSAGLDLNPHPFKNKRVRHPNTIVKAKFWFMATGSGGGRLGRVREV